VAVTAELTELSLAPRWTVRIDESAVTAIPVEITRDAVQIGGFGTRFLANGDDTHGAYALIEHSLGPGLLGAPPHRHAHEDEVSYVLAGELAVWKDGVVSIAKPGTVARKPRGEWHTFWNPGDVPVRFLEIISPPGFALYFHELGALLGETGQPDPARIAELAGRYGLEFDFDAMGPLAEQHGLKLG